MGHMNFLVIPFRLYNASAIFMSTMNAIFHEEMDGYMVEYNDNILIYSKNEEDHKRDLKSF